MKYRITTNADHALYFIQSEITESVPANLQQPKAGCVYLALAYIERDLNFARRGLRQIIQVMYNVFCQLNFASWLEYETCSSGKTGANIFNMAVMYRWKMINMLTRIVDLWSVFQEAGKIHSYLIAILDSN